jgi:hypothetical protein
VQNEECHNYGSKANFMRRSYLFWYKILGVGWAFRKGSKANSLKGNYSSNSKGSIPRPIPIEENFLCMVANILF